MLETPVLFLIFNRPDTTERVFKRIRQVKPQQLFIAADGPRKVVQNDKELCHKTRAIIEKIDWNCDVKTLFREENLGCAKAVSSAITWFFEHVEEGIILEDDCLPDKTFFYFCQLMLSKYRDNEQIMQISGNNFLYNEFKKQNNSYFFSSFNDIWGWATWRNEWAKFSLDLKNGNTIEAKIVSRISNPDFCIWILSLFQSVKEEKVNSWGIPWSFYFHLNDGICIVPNGNLVKNIGYTGTHFLSSFKNPMLNINLIPFNINKIIHPDEISIDIQKDNLTFKNILKPKWTFYDRLHNKIKRIYLKIRRD